MEEIVRHFGENKNINVNNVNNIDINNFNNVKNVNNVNNLNTSTYNIEREIRGKNENIIPVQVTVVNSPVSWQTASSDPS